MDEEGWRQGEVAVKDQDTRYVESTHLNGFLQPLAAILHECIPIPHRPWNCKQNL